MKKLTILLLLLAVVPSLSFALPSKKNNLIIAPATLTENSVTLLWDKQAEKSGVIYEILLNGKAVGSTSKTNYTVTNLLPATSYAVSVRIKQDKNSKAVSTTRFKTAAR